MASARQSWFDNSALKKKEETEELLVFGYSCKLFRDDEKALYIDQGKHLIPWMGDDALKIDRYDVRGTVYDLRPLEPLGGGASEALWSSLSDAERRVEQLCDEERYRALYHNEAEEALYQEEELKRLHKALDPHNSYGQVAYSYDSEADGNKPDDKNTKDTNEDMEDDDEPFVAPQELDIPVGMVLPERLKLNAIIEKTALFISTQGPQMEILLKMKQSNNPQFSFLSFDCELHPYYRHLLMAIKTGRYRPKQPHQQEETQENENMDHYLHPSLAATSSRVELAPNIPSISYKPSADCAYSMLVNKIKDKQLKSADSQEPGVPGQSQSSRSPSPSRMNQLETVAPSIVLPPPDVQIIIDKMASYVIKNGRDFEAVVRGKGDDRFAFLDSAHQFYPYYEHKMRTYQSIDAPSKHAQLPPGSQKCATNLKKKVDRAKSPEKKPRPILLPGYEYSDDSSESDEGDVIKHNGNISGKPKLAPVCFSIKKPKEAEILKEVRSALPIEEESSEDEGDTESGVAHKSSQLVQEPKPTDQTTNKTYQQPLVTDINPVEEMEKLQKMLKEKELLLKEREREQKLAGKRRQEILIEDIDMKSAAVEPMVQPPIPKTEQDKSFSLKKEIASPESTQAQPKDEKCDTFDREAEKSSKENKVVDQTKEMLAEVVAEAEIIDLTDETDDAPKVTDSMRLERKRKAAAFLNSLRKEHSLAENVKMGSDSDVSSKRSTPSPLPQHMQEKTEVNNFNGAGIPRTSLMARLAASSVGRQSNTDRKSTKHKARLTENIGNRNRDKHKGHVNSSRHRRKRKSPSSDRERSKSHSRSRSRSVSHSRSPNYRHRQGEDSDTERHAHLHRKDRFKNNRRRKCDFVDEADIPSKHSHHHRRHKSSHHGQSHSKRIRESRTSSSDSSDSHA